MIDCNECKYWDEDEGVCGAFECYGLGCPPLPCEEDEEECRRE